MLKRSDSKNRITAHIRKAKAGIRRHYRMVSVLAAFVALLTMYMLILPAKTLDDSTAQQTPGIEVSAADGGQQEVNETVGETEDRPSNADTEEKDETSEKDEQKTSDDVKTGRKAANRTDSVLKETVETDKGDYEITVKWAGSHPDNPLVKVILWPGMQMQYLTTREPDDGQIECAIAAMKLVLEREQREGALDNG